MILTGQNAHCTQYIVAMHCYQRNVMRLFWQRKDRDISLFLQACCRGWQQRRRLAALRAAAIVIQKHWRSAKLRRDFRSHVACIVLAQSCVRRRASAILRSVPPVLNTHTECEPDKGSLCLSMYVAEGGCSHHGTAMMNIARQACLLSPSHTYSSWQRSSINRCTTSVCHAARQQNKPQHSLPTGKAVS